MSQLQLLLWWLSSFPLKSLRKEWESAALLLKEQLPHSDSSTLFTVLKHKQSMALRSVCPSQTTWKASRWRLGKPGEEWELASWKHFIVFSPGAWSFSVQVNRGIWLTDGKEQSPLLPRMSKWFFLMCSYLSYVLMPILYFCYTACENHILISCEDQTYANHTSVIEFVKWEHPEHPLDVWVVYQVVSFRL